MKLDDFEYNYIEQIYDYHGQWGRKSKCGLKIINNGNKKIVVVTDLYEENPGDSITESCPELAMLICKEFSININELTFIHHVPEVNSKLEFYEEVFYSVKFENKEGQLSSPDWEQISRHDFEEMVKH